MAEGGGLSVNKTLYILSMPRSDEGVYVFDNFEAVEASLRISCSMLKNKYVLERQADRSWRIRICDITQGIVREIHIDHVRKDGVHL
jgi:hypothetical protein